MTFEQLEVGDKFKTVGKITGGLSQYTWTKTEPIKGWDNATYNGVTYVGAKKDVDRRGSFYSDELVVKIEEE